MAASTELTARQRAILDFIIAAQRERGFPPSVREIGEAVGLTSPSTVHTHLATLQRRGYLRRDPTKPRAIEVRYDPASGASVERRPVSHVPLVGDVAAENVEELVPVPSDLTGEGPLFMLRVRGDSMVEAGILDGDFVVVRSQEEARDGEVVVAGIPGDEATVKTLRRRGDAGAVGPGHLHRGRRGTARGQPRQRSTRRPGPTAPTPPPEAPRPACRSAACPSTSGGPTTGTRTTAAATTTGRTRPCTRGRGTSPRAPRPSR
jgi:repressor LexA